eukprot:m.233044 g.233044  ORF g.233044 m.233044 type:complete len:464 (-) comp15241_c0_seq2:248-1639(-)
MLLARLRHVVAKSNVQALVVCTRHQHRMACSQVTRSRTRHLLPSLPLAPLMPGGSACVVKLPTRQASRIPSLERSVQAVNLAAGFDLRALRRHLGVPDHVDFDHVAPIAPSLDTPAPKFTVMPLPRDLQKSLIRLQRISSEPVSSAEDLDVGRSLINGSTTISLDATQDQQQRQQAIPLHQLGSVAQDVFVFSSGTIVSWGTEAEVLEEVSALCKPFAFHHFDTSVVEEEREIVAFETASTGVPRVVRGRFVLSAQPDSDAWEYSWDASKDTSDWPPLTSDVDDTHTRTSMSTSTSTSAGNDTAVLGHVDVDHTTLLQKFAFSHALASSVELGMLESKLTLRAQNMSIYPERIQGGKPLQITRQQLFQQYGELLFLKHRHNMPLDYSNFYWDREALGALYDKACNYLDIAARSSRLTRQLEHHTELAELLRTTLSERHSTKLEWLIIVLIFIEVVFEFSKYMV